MNLRGVLFLLGRILLALAAALLIPAAVAFRQSDPELTAFLLSAAVAGLAGILLERGFVQRRDFAFGRKEAFVLVTVAWLTASVVGALPYVFVKGPGFIVSALFESASGFTTTGASVLADVESEPTALLLWRAMTQWLGGMGIIVLGIAILPKLAIGGMELLGAEAPGPTTEKLTPRIAQTAKALWGIYALLTGAEAVVLGVLGVPPLEAVAHAFTTMATGGFSTRNASIGAFDSVAIDLVVTLFMVLAGANFALHFQLFRGKGGALVRDPEFRIYGAILGAGTLLIATDLVVQGHVDDVATALRLAVFQATSIITTTGYATANFDAWPYFSMVLLFLMMFVGGCAGSTGGSVKVVRNAIVGRKLVVDLRRMIHPHAVLPVRLGGRAIPDDVVSSVMTFLIVYLVIFVTGGLALVAMRIDPATAFSASASCLGNVGPGFARVGPELTYAPLPAAAKLILSAEMILGRLELYTVLVIFFLRRRL
jgi:trk system potassium uptake protein TrkH